MLRSKVSVTPSLNPPVVRRSVHTVPGRQSNEETGVLNERKPETFDPSILLASVHNMIHNNSNAKLRRGVDRLDRQISASPD